MPNRIRMAFCQCRRNLTQVFCNSGLLVSAADLKAAVVVMVVSSACDGGGVCCGGGDGGVGGDGGRERLGVVVTVCFFWG